MKSADISLRFGPGINLTHAENVVAELGNESIPQKMVQLDFGKCRHIDVGAGWRVGNSLRRYAQALLLDVILPDVSSEKDFSGRWFLAFTRSGLGISIAKHAPLIRSSQQEVTELVRSYYQSRLQEVWTNLVIVQSLEQGLAIDVNNFNSFLIQFHRWLPVVNVPEGTFEEKDIHSLAQLCFEAIQNVYDHANRTPLPSKTEILSYFSLRYHKMINRPITPSGDFTSYIERLRNLDQGRYSGRFLEIVTNDDGVGISARQSQTLDVYWSEPHEEGEALKDALASGSSIKLKTKDTIIRGDPGYGFTHIQDSLRQLHAYAALRTGRRLAVFDGTLPSANGFELTPDILGYMPGTALHIVLPIPSRQLGLF